MIEYLRGDLTEHPPTIATVECHGVGYLTNISLNTYTAAASQKVVKSIIKEQPSITVEAAIKEALRRM